MTLTIVVFFSALRLDPTQPAATTGLGFFMITIGQAIAAPAAGLLFETIGATNAFVAFATLTALTITTTPVSRPLSA